MTKSSVDLAHFLLRAIVLKSLKPKVLSKGLMLDDHLRKDTLMDSRADTNTGKRLLHWS